MTVTETAAPTAHRGGSPASGSRWAGTADAVEVAHWEQVAAEVAARLADSVLERDRVGADPDWELDVLRESGLVGLLIPAEFGGGGGHWESAFRAVRVLSRVDAGVAQVLAYHYVNSGNIPFAAAPADRERWYRASVAGHWVWGDSVNPTDPDLVLTRDGAGYRLDGTKRFSTGASAGDVILVAATARDAAGVDEGPVLLVVDHDRAGIEFLGDWDFLGQRLSASGSVRYAGVSVAADDILGPLTDVPFATLITPAIQLFFGNLYLGIAQGALAQAAEVTRARRNAWFLSQAETYRDDPFVQRLYGELDAVNAAVEALADRVGARFDDAVAEGADLTAEARGALAIDVARLKVVASDAATDATNRVFEATGSSSTRTGVGLDLHWRNVRTHSLHDPVDYKKLEVGAFYLNGQLQPISLYT